MPLKSHQCWKAFGCAWLAFLAAGMEAVGDAPPSFHVRQWTSEDGLPANRIAALAQTPDGYLWVGTWFGLARFDGVRFVVFNRANTPALPVEAIRDLAVDRDDGTLWIGTPAALVRFKEGRFERVAPTGSSGGETWNISELLPSAGGGVWVRAADKLRHWPPLWTGWSKLRLADAESVKAMWETEDGALELMTHRRMFRVARDGVVLQHQPPPGIPANESWTAAWPKDQQGRFWLATKNASHRRDGSGWHAVQVLPVRSFPRDRFIEDQSGALWAAHSGVGLWCHFSEVQESIRLGERGAEKSVDCLLADREGHVWAGTSQGLFQIRPRLIRAYSEEDGLAHRECWSIAEAPDGTVWVRTKRGPARILADRIEPFPDEPSRYQTESILVDREHRVWLGAERHNGVIAWLPRRETNSFWRDPRSGSVSGLGLGALYLDRAGRVWAGTDRGPVWFEQGKPAVEFGELGLPTNGVRSIYQTRDGAMWFGTWQAGVVRWSARPAGPSAPHSVTRFTTADGLADNRVFVFHEDADGALWIGTHNGLSRFKDGNFLTFRAEQGLFDNLINWMEEDDFGRFWFSCNRGIFRIDRMELNAVADGKTTHARAIVYGASDGMLNPETNGERQPAGCKTRDGRIWFPTMDGVVVIDPRRASTTEVAPVAVIEAVRADGLPVASLARLSAGRARDLQVRYTANSFLDPRRNRFQYRLAHHDAGWRDETTERLAVYTNLRPGDYRFEVRAANAHDVWSQEPAVFTFSLAPHFWQTWPFYVLCGAVAIGLAASFTSYRLRWQHRLLSARHEQALAEERARIARDLHDDLGSALTGVALEIEVTRRQPQDGVAARLGESASRVRALAERMREVVWAVNPRCDTVSSLASFLEQQAGALLQAAGVRGRFEFPENIPTLPLDSETRHQLALGVREALVNVTRHARASEVIVALALNAEALTVSVRDDGRGFDIARVDSGAGHGLHNLRTRLAQVGGTVTIDSKPGAGTRVEFRVPLNRPPSQRTIP